MVVIIYNNVIIWEKYHNKTNISYSPGGDVKKKKRGLKPRHSPLALTIKHFGKYQINCGRMSLPQRNESKACDIILPRLFVQVRSVISDDDVNCLPVLCHHSETVTNHLICSWCKRRKDDAASKRTHTQKYTSFRMGVIFIQMNGCCPIWGSLSLIFMIFTSRNCPFLTTEFRFLFDTNRIAPSIVYDED